jgi:potassium-dependent mechanosensitive channel
MKYLIILLIFLSSSFAVNIDKSWYNNTNEELTKIYIQQNEKILELKKSEQNSEIKQQIDYQSLLLKKLQKSLSSTSDFNFKDITQIDNIDEYIEKIKQYSKIDEYYKNIKTNLDNNSKKLQTLEDQINKFTNKEDITTVNSQLLYAYYMIEDKRLKNEITNIQTYIKKYKESLLKTLSSKTFVLDENLNSKIEKTNTALSSLLKEERRVSLALDKATISENESKTKALEKELQQIKDDKLVQIDNLVYLKVEELLIPLQNKKNKYFDLNNSLEQFIKDNDIKYTSLFDLLKYLSREHIGLTKSTFADTKESIFDIIKYGWAEINKPIIPLGDGVSILAISKFFFIFIIGFMIASFYRKKLSSGTKYLRNTSVSTRTMLSNLGYYFLVVITFIFALNSIGIDLSSLTILVGALSVGIGFGLQNIVSNFISGIILIFEKSIQVGNIIEIENEVRGKVTQINMRSSVITTFDNIDIIIPNSTLIQNSVINLTFADDIRRLHVPFGVAYGSDIDTVIKTILEALDKSNLIYIKHDGDREPRVWMTGMGASSVDFKLLVWINANTNRMGADSSNLSDFLIFVYKTLQENNIEIPFPQLDLHIKKDK